MERQPVTSTNVASVGYNPTSQTLEVEFTNGSTYQYFDVPAQVYEALIAAASIGTFLNDQVKGVYRYARV